MNEIDPISNVILSRLNSPLVPAGDDSLQAFKESKRVVKHKFVPGASDNGYVFVTCNPQYVEKVKPFDTDFRLESVGVPHSLSNIDANYEQYLCTLFEVYHSLDNYKYPISLNEIGLKNSNVEARKTQSKILYGAIELMVDSLELLINKKIDIITGNQNDDIDIDNDGDDSSQTNINGDELKDRMYDLKDYYNVLNFIKAIYFSSDLNFTKNLSIWLNRSDYDNPPREVIKEIANVPNPYKTDFFFKFLNQLLLRGLFTQAQSSLVNLGYSSLFETNEFTASLFEQLIKLINDYKVIFNAGNADDEISGDNAIDFSYDPGLQEKLGILFKNFKKNVLKVISDINSYLVADDTSEDILSSEDKAVLLFLKNSFTLLSGSKTAILDLANSWFEALNGLILFDLPNSRLIPEYLDLIATSGKDKFEIDYTNTWELICYSLIKNDNFLLALRSLELLDSNSASYLSVLLDAKGFLKDYQKLEYLKEKATGDSQFSMDLDVDLGFETEQDEVENFGDDVASLSISQYLLYNHAMNCFSNKKLIPVGVGILKSLNLRNYKQILTEFLPYNFFSENNDDAEWLLGICGENKLIHLSNSLFKLFGLNFYQNKLPLESLENLRKAGDYKWIVRIVWEIFAKKLGDRYDNNDLATQEISIIDLVINEEDFDLNEIKILTDAQKAQLADYTLDPLLKRFLSPYYMLLRYINNEISNSFNVSKEYLIKLINFKFLPPKLLGILLLFLLKYFYLNFTSGNYYSIGLSIFENHELTAIIETLNQFERLLEAKKSLKSQNNKVAELVNAYYAEFTKLHYNTLHREYSGFGIELPKTVGELINSLRMKVSLEISRKYLE